MKQNRAHMSAAFCYKTLRNGHGQIHKLPKKSSMFLSKTIHSRGEKAVTGDYKYSPRQQSFPQELQNQHIPTTSTYGKWHSWKLNGAVGHLSWGRELPWTDLSQLKDNLTRGKELAWRVIRGETFWFTGSLQEARAHCVVQDNKP